MLNGELNPENTPCPMAYSTRENAMSNGEFNLTNLTRENAMPNGEFNLKTRHAQWRVTLILIVFPKIDENESQYNPVTLMKGKKSQKET